MTKIIFTFIRKTLHLHIMRNQWIAIFFLLTWLSQVGDRYVVMLGFRINQEFIAKNLCENRNRPELHCNGHCQLTKKLAEEQKKDQESPLRKADNKSEIFYPHIKADHSLAAVCITLANDRHIPSSIGSPVDQPTSVFHPPAA